MGKCFSHRTTPLVSPCCDHGVEVVRTQGILTEQLPGASDRRDVGGTSWWRGPSALGRHWIPPPRTRQGACRLSVRH